MNNYNELFLGARPYDFIDEVTKRKVSGVSVYIAETGTEGVAGYTADKISMQNEDFNRVFGSVADFAKLVLKPVSIVYTKHGKPVAYELATQQQK